MIRDTLRVLLDANVLINYLLTPNPDRAAATLIRAAASGVFTLPVVDELAEETWRRVVGKPSLARSISPDQLDRLWTLPASVAEVLPSLPGPFPSRGRDRTDDYLLAYAIEFRADFLVSWDKDLRVLREVGEAGSLAQLSSCTSFVSRGVCRIVAVQRSRRVPVSPPTVADSVDSRSAHLMPRTDDLLSLPSDLPVPSDDGACDHLPGLRLPALPLPATSGDPVDLSSLPGRTVVYCYPRTGRPDEEPPSGLAGWNAVPGARGCTPQSCAYRDHHAELQALGARVFGLSTQGTAYQQETADRLHLPVPLLSDADLAFARAIRLPTFEVAGLTLIKRLTLIVAGGRIEDVFYPVFPPDADAGRVIAWLQEHQQG